MGRFSAWAGYTEIKIDGMELKLKAKVEDLQQFMDIRGKKENTLVEMHKMVLGMMKRSYPDENADEIENFVTANIAKMIPELAVAWKLITREELEKGMKAAEEKKLSGQ